MRSDSNSATMARTLKSSRPTGSVGSYGPAQIETHLSNRESVGDRPCVRKGPCQPIELGDNQRVALSTGGQGLAQARPFAIGARESMVNVDPIGSHSERGQAVALGSEVLLIGRYSGVSDEERCHSAPPVMGRLGGFPGYRQRPEPLHHESTASQSICR